jgi:pyruvate dehydrogenase E2 component (dihydrolipoamide acetyltransferase)
MREIVVPMPKMSMTMEEGELLTWRKQEGEQVRAGEVICEVMSDKVDMEVESPSAGTLVRHVASEGDTVAVGAPIAMLATEAEDLLGDLFAPPSDVTADAGVIPAAPEAPTTPPVTAGPPPTTGAPPTTVGGPRPVVPAARRRAAELGVDLRTVDGSGRDGLVLIADVEAAVGDGKVAGAAAAAAAAQPALVAPPAAAAPAAAPPAVSRPPAAPARPPAPAAAAAPPVPLAPAAAPSPTVAADVEEIPLSNMRRVVARRLVESMQSAPHFFLTSVIDAEALLAFRADLNRRLDAAGEPVKVSVNDLIVKACATALRANPALNVSWHGDKILRHHRVHIGVAVAIEGGLIVPVVRDADRKTLTEVSRDTRALAEKARAGKLITEEFSGGTFTVSNLGMFGIDQFTAIINPPEAAILAVGATSRAAVVRDEQVVVRSLCKLTLSIDHRPVDGATGAQFLQTLKALLEDPLRIIA